MPQLSTIDGVAVKVRTDGYVCVGRSHSGTIVRLTYGDRCIERKLDRRGAAYFGRAYEEKEVHIGVIGHVDNPPTCSSCDERKKYVDERRIHGWFCTEVECSVGK